MAQDIRKMLKEHRPETPKLSKGHENRFEAKLAALSSEEKNKNHSFFWLKIAAVGILFLSLGYFGYQQLSKDDIPEVQVAEVNETKDTPQFTLGDISPSQARTLCSKVSPLVFGWQRTEGIISISWRDKKSMTYSPCSPT